MTLSHKVWILLDHSHIMLISSHILPLFLHVTDSDYTSMYTIVMILYLTIALALALALALAHSNILQLTMM